MVNKIITYFEPDNKEIDQLDQWRNRIAVIFILLLCGLLTVMWIPVVLGFSKEYFPFIPILVICLGILFVFKKTGNKDLVMNALIFCLLMGNTFNSYHTGGIFSYNLRWYIFPIILAFLFINLRYTIFWLFSCIGVVIMFYLIHDPSFREIAESFTAANYLIDNLFFLCTFSLIIYVFYSLQKKNSTALNEKNKLLEQQKLKVESKQRQLKELTAKLADSNKNLERYAHTTAHDLKQPVRTIASFAQLIDRDIKKNKITERTSTSLNFVISSAVKLSEMIENLLAFAKSDYDGALEKQEINLDHTLLKIKGDLDAQIKDSGADVVICPMPKIKGNKIQIERVFQNLISNALKYTHKGILPVVEVCHQIEDKQHRFSIIDNGIGIKKEDFTKIFNVFQQIEGVDREGFGVGLSTCKKIIENHGGKIWVESEINKGSKFIFTIPLEENEVTDQESPEEQKQVTVS